jgi:hypothetical protein
MIAPGWSSVRIKSGKVYVTKVLVSTVIVTVFPGYVDPPTYTVRHSWNTKGSEQFSMS